MDLNDYFLYQNLAVDYLKEMQGLYDSNLSNKGGRTLMNYNEKKLTMVCSKCKSSKSIRKNAFFQDRKLKTNRILAISYFWLTKAIYTSTCLATGICSKTITSYFNNFRDLVEANIEE